MQPFCEIVVLLMDQAVGNAMCVCLCSGRCAFNNLYSLKEFWNIFSHSCSQIEGKKCKKKKKKAVCQQLEKHEMEHLFTFVLLMHSTK